MRNLENGITRKTEHNPDEVETVDMVGVENLTTTKPRVRDFVRFDSPQSGVARVLEHSIRAPIHGPSRCGPANVAQQVWPSRCGPAGVA